MKHLSIAFLVWMSVFLTPFTGSMAGESKDSDPIKGAYKASTVIGKPVKTLQDDDLGTVEDIVIETTGEVAYAVLSFGGLLGVGDKLFAVPWTALAHSPDGKYLTLDVDPKRLENAPGFNKRDWPDMEDQQWKLVISEFYKLHDKTNGLSK